MFRAEYEKSCGNRVISMSNMQPCQIGKIVEGLSQYVGHLVMRTASEDRHEVMDLTEPGCNKCWTYGKSMKNSEVKVRLLKPGEGVKLVITC